MRALCGRVTGVNRGVNRGVKILQCGVYSGIYAIDGGALFLGVYIGRFYRGKWALFEESSQKY